MQEFASELRAQRESSGMSLEELFERTRINPDYLRAIESGNYDVLPEIYVRLFIKKYAQEIGLDVEETLARYEKNRPVTVTAQRVASRARERSLPLGRILGSLSVLALIAVVAGVFLRRDSTSVTPASTGAPVSEYVAPSADSDPEPSTTPDPQDPPAEPESPSEPAFADTPRTAPRELDITVNREPGERVVSAYSLPQQYSGIWEDEIILRIDALMDTRVLVFSDGDSTFDNRLLSGTQRKWTALNGFRVEIEDPSAVSLFLQDKPVSLSTEPGLKRRLFISRHNVWVEEIESVLPPPVR
ncbi:MAG: helix-turn-helix domain-containing protein [Gemmatimonadota bacterium]|nr:helix-turn-helix domain-containing protein [Gemmatimonadota bacterium]